MMLRTIFARAACTLVVGLALLASTVTAAGAATPEGTFGWGFNETHQLSDDTTTNRSTPVEVQGLPEEAVGLAAQSSSAALLRDGRVMTWGEGDLGGGIEGPSAVPIPVCAVGAEHCPGGPYLEGVSSIAAGNGFYLALLKDGTVVGWGNSNRAGQLGNGFGQTSPTPGHVCTVKELPCAPAHYLKGVTAISAGKSHALAMLEDGTVVAWGENRFDQLGVKKTSVKCQVKGQKCSTVPLAVPGLGEVTRVVAGEDFSLALTKAGIVMAWGFNVDGSLGNGRKSPKVATPAPVCAGYVKNKCKGELSEVASIAVDGETAFAVMRDGTVRSWGSNDNGLLGIGAATGPEECAFPCSRTPLTVSGLAGVRSMSSNSGSQTALAQLQDDTFVTWGAGFSGQLGDGEKHVSSFPVHVCAPFASGPCPGGPYLTGPATAFTAGGAHMLVGFPVE
jgi:alpha-tubulin suppressor-like RCC1 family protein